MGGRRWITAFAGDGDLEVDFLGGLGGGCDGEGVGLAGETADGELIVALVDAFEGVVARIVGDGEDFGFGFEVGGFYSGSACGVAALVFDKAADEVGGGEGNGDFGDTATDDVYPQGIKARSSVDRVASGVDI